MRYFGSLFAGVVVAIGLFLLMHALISKDPTIGARDDDAARLDFVRVKQDEIEQIKERKKPPPPEKPKEPPPPPKLTVNNQDKPPPDMPPIDAPRVSVPIASGSGPYLGGWSPGEQAPEGDVIPIVRIEPQYPREAALEGIGGWVKLEFTIEPDGTVSDVIVVDSDPRRIFDRNAQRALYRWKFKPRVVDGKPIARRATQTLEFKLNQ